MNLEPVTQNDVKSEKEKQISYINTHIYMESRKIVLLNLLEGQE